MARMRRKSELPQKTCAVCGRPFTWRKKWAAVWDEVRYCSDKCRSLRGVDVTSTKRPRG
ncbi:DUF2256 domain-containing protein [Aliishimia ponticola]|uniref:DUF2256 domain-containing protein n=1 Tax=Aliishimia ponticola TaxID=2499833 RepID=A0A4S4NH74_9RHOB|nr:DUF2256 domain-containing protein [Aliishimia ponticola]THH39024.1 DUF2256 domain-containing protein [Aliishimia ponticola]